MLRHGMTEFSRRGTQTQSVASKKLANCRGESQNVSLALIGKWGDDRCDRFGCGNERLLLDEVRLSPRASRCDQGSTFHISRNAGRCATGTTHNGLMA